MTTKAQRMYEFIKSQVESGKTCYLATATRITKIQSKHLDQVRVRGEALEIQCGRCWLDYTHTALTAQ